MRVIIENRLAIEIGPYDVIHMSWFGIYTLVLDLHL